MNLFYQFILTLLLGLAAQLFLPWWWVLVAVAFIVGLLFYYENSFLPFLMSFLAGALLWWGMAYFLSTLNNDILAQKMGSLFGGISPLWLELSAGVLGGLLAGLGALSANLGRKMIKKSAT